MKKLNGRETKALLILSIVVPVSLLTTFRLTGLLAEPLRLESLFVEAVKWKIDRPRFDVNIKESVENSYSNGNVSVVFKVFIDDYDADAGAFGGSGTINMNLTATANVSGGYVESMRVVFREDFKPSEIWMKTVPDEIRTHFQLKNLSVNELAARGWNERKLENNTKGFVTFASVNKPSSVYFNFPVDWALRSGYEQNHKLETVLELVCRTKHSYMKIVIPIQLQLTSLAT